MLCRTVERPSERNVEKKFQRHCKERGEEKE
jgi:hypothetical protein